MTVTFWTSEVTATVLHTSERTLERRRQDGTGPKFLRWGRRILYRPEDVEQWAQENAVSSTAEADTHMTVSPCLMTGEPDENLTTARRARARGRRRRLRPEDASPAT